MKRVPSGAGVLCHPHCLPNAVACKAGTQEMSPSPLLSPAGGTVIGTKPPRLSLPLPLAQRLASEASVNSEQKGPHWLFSEKLVAWGRGR